MVVKSNCITKIILRIKVVDLFNVLTKIHENGLNY
jgi:hypothetical protein